MTQEAPQPRATNADGPTRGLLCGHTDVANRVLRNHPLLVGADHIDAEPPPAHRDALPRRPVGRLVEDDAQPTAACAYALAYLYIEAFIKPGHSDLRFAKSRRERLHGAFLPVG